MRVTTTGTDQATTALIIGILGLVLRAAVAITLFVIGQWILGLLLLIAVTMIDHADKTLGSKGKE